MTKYIKSKDGKFAGSIGDGKTNVPSAAPTSLPPVENSVAHDSSVDAAYKKFTEKANPYKLAAWAVEPNYKWFKPKNACEWDSGWVMSKDTENDDDDNGHDWAIDYITGVLKTEQVVGSPWNEHGRVHAYYAITGIKDVGRDGNVMAIWHSANEDNSDPKNVVGYLTPNGKFYSDEEDTEDTVNMSIAYESVLRENAGASLEEIEWNLQTDDAGTPLALEVKAQSEWYRPTYEDPNDEYDPDRYL